MAERTIYDIAKMAGVSASTVSRVINNKDGVRKETRERISQLLKQYNYIPNETARGLVNQSSRIIGILIADIRTTHHTDAVYFIERAFAKQGYCCLILNTGTDPQEQAHYIQLLSQRKVDAAIFIGSIYQNDAIRQAVQTYLASTPIVLFNGYLDAPNLYGIIADEEGGVRSCVKLLAEKGRRHLGFIVNQDTPSNLLKQSGFRLGMAMYCPDQPPCIEKLREDEENSVAATRRLLKANPVIDGIIYSEDLLALAGLQAMLEDGIRVPQQIAVVGINNSLYAQTSYPPMTSLDNMLYDLSMLAVHSLLQLLRGERVNQKMILGTQIVERKTT